MYLSYLSENEKIHQNLKKYLIFLRDWFILSTVEANIVFKNKGVLVGRIPFRCLKGVCST